MGATQTVSVHRSLRTSLFGAEARTGKAWSILATRLALGFLFLWGGIEKMQTWGGLWWSGSPKTMVTSGFLKYAVSGPFAGFFNGLAGNVAVEYLIVYGELLIGISIVFGIFTRVGAVSGIAMNGLFYLSRLPVQNNPFVNDYIIYMLIFAAFIFLVPGRFLGLDGILQNVGFVERRPTLRKFLGYVG